jgi:L-amino acid N-acyltransferase YncA
MTIRDAREADLPAIVGIYNSIIPGRMVTADLAPVTVESRAEWFLARDVSRRPIWVVEHEGAVCAWLSFETFYPRSAYDGTAMVGLYVRESKRRTGLGRQLLTRAIEHAPRLGLTTLLGYIFAHNEPSLRLFGGFGFERWALLPRIARFDDVERDLVILGKRVG